MESKTYLQPALNRRIRQGEVTISGFFRVLLYSVVELNGVRFNYLSLWRCGKIAGMIAPKRFLRNNPT
jgi:hypothetical protein